MILRHWLHAVVLLQIIFGFVTIFFSEEIFQYLIRSQLVVVEGTRAYQAWSRPPALSTEFYFYNLLNPEQFLKEHAKPILEEKGPYTFREVQSKVDIDFKEDHTVEYRRKKLWYFQPEKSVGSLTDPVLTINLPLLAAANYARGNFFLEYGLANVFASLNAELFVNKTIGELLFDGYDEPIMELAGYDEINMELGEFDDPIIEQTEEETPSRRFGWFYNMNGSSQTDGLLRMATGEEELERLGEIVSWDGEDSTLYPGHCAPVRGP